MEPPVILHGVPVAWLVDPRGPGKQAAAGAIRRRPAIRGPGVRRTAVGEERGRAKTTTMAGQGVFRMHGVARGRGTGSGLHGPP